MHDGFVAFSLGTKRHAVFKRARIRAAPDRNGFGFFARTVLVNRKQRLNERAVFILIQRGLLVNDFVRRPEFVQKGGNFA